MQQETEWFEEWFDSPYYHILYGDRDMKEAEYFLENLINKFNPAKDTKLIDLACGAGRHSIYLNSLGFDVTGVDLSEHSISLAKPFENSRLHFEVGDLRNLNLASKFDIALNLFTSFGYFDCFATNMQVLGQVKALLNPRGYFLIDFMNAPKVLSKLVAAEQVHKNTITFNIQRRLQQGLIVKDISFELDRKNYSYQEKVQALTLVDFETMLHGAGFQIMEIFGNYKLDTFDEQDSDRLILICKNQDA
jgi:SAM-dependent methyltransferase